MDVSLVRDLWRDAHGHPLPVSNLLRELRECDVEGIGWAEVGGVEEVVAGLWVLHEPWSVERGVVPDNIDKREDTPFLVHFFDDLTQINVAGVDLNLFRLSLRIHKGHLFLCVGVVGREVGGVDAELV